MSPACSLVDFVTALFNFYMQTIQSLWDKVLFHCSNSFTQLFEWFAFVVKQYLKNSKGMVIRLLKLHPRIFKSISWHKNANVFSECLTQIHHQHSYLNNIVFRIFWHLLLLIKDISSKLFGILLCLRWCSGHKSKEIRK